MGAGFSGVFSAVVGGSADDRIVYGSSRSANGAVSGDCRSITASTINNYVRLKLLPPPRKKRYSRLHLAYLLMICALKPTMSISDLQKLLPYDLDEAQMQQIYSDFVSAHAKTSLYFLEQVKNLEPKATEQSMRTFICQSAIISGLVQSLNEQLLSTNKTEK